MKSLITYVILLFSITSFSLNLNAQTCFAEGLVMYSQDVATNFADDYPDCTIIEGDIILGDAVNFLGMEQIVEIQGLIRCDEAECETNFENFLGLENVVSLGGIDIENREITFAGLNSLVEINGSLKMTGCSFPNFESLNNLTQIQGGFNMVETDFESFQGLQNLTNVQFEFKVKNNDFITNCDYLNSLESAGTIEFTHCAVLDSFLGFENLLSAGFQLIIAYCPSVSSLEGFESLIQVTEMIEFVGNSSLSDISAISNIDENFLWVFIGENLSLSECSLENFCQHLASQSDLQSDFWVNGAGCNTLEEVVEGCGFSNIVIKENSPFEIVNTAVTNILKLKNPTQQSFSIYNSMGNLLLQSNENSQLDVSHFPAGLYILTVPANKESFRFIIQ